MSDTIDSLSLTVDEATAADLRELLKTLPGSEGRFLERNNGGGDAVTWIVLVSLATPLVPQFLNFFRDRADRKTPRRVSYKGDGVEYEIENPTPEDLEIFRQRIADRDRGGSAGSAA